MSHPVAGVQADRTNEWPALAALSYATAIYALFFNLQPVLVGVLQETFGFDEQQLGSLMSAGLLAAFTVLASAYFWVKLVRRRAAIGAGICVALAGLGVNLGAQGFAGTAMGMVLFGAGLAVTAAPVVLALGELSNPTKAFGWAVTTMVLVAAACVLLIPTWVFPVWGYAGVISLAILLVAATLLVLPWVPEPQVNAATIALPTPKANLPVWLALAATSLYMLGLNSNWAFLEVFGDRALIPPEAISAAISAGLLVGAVGSMAASWLNTRLSVARAMGMAVLGFACYAALLANAEGPWGFGASVVLLCLVWNFSLPYTMEAVRLQDHSGRMLGLIPAAQALGGALGPLAASGLLAAQGPVALHLLLLGCAAVVALVFWWLARSLLPTKAPT